MSATPKSDKHVQGDYADTSTVSPLAGGHKPSFRGTKLARRARSFKEDFLEKISAMRSPGGGSSSAIGIRTHSPGGSPKSRHHHDNSVTPDSVHISDKTNPSRELESLVRQVQIALKHFRDVVTKNKLEMLPGNGTIVLDNVTSIHIALKQYLLDTTACNHSASLRSATHQVYQSLARLIKLCDDVLLFGDQSAALEKGNVVEVVTLVEDAVQNLVKLAQDKISNREPQYKPLPVPQRTSYGSNSISLDIPGQRNSLPDIPLTPRERQILEDTSSPVNLVRNSHSSESILCDSSPPPKPPLPDNICLSEPDSNSCGTPPPIPPKKRLPRTQQLIDECGSSDNSLLGCSLDIVSLRSRSPEDSSSLLSASAGSLDSVLNQSRDEEEIRGLMDQSVEDNIHNDLSELISQGENGPCHCNWADPTSDSHNPTIGLLQQSHELQPFSVDINLLSNTESGIGSSIRSSVQSFSTMSTSKRSSQQSSTSSQWSACNKHTSSQVNATFSQQNAFVKSESIIQNLSSVQKSESIIHNLSLRSELSEEKIIENLSQCVLKSETNIQNFSKSTFSSTTLSNMSQASTIIGLDNVDCGLINHSEENGVPPQLPQKMRPKKTRSERRPSQYDNVPPDALGEHVVTCAMHQSQQSPIPSNNQVDSNRTESPEKGPPPLPPKKKHIMAYMEMFGNCSHSSGNVDFLRHSMHTYNMMQADGFIQTESGYGGQVSHHSSMLSTTQSCSFSVSHGENLNNTNLAQSNNTSVGDISITMNLPSPPKSPISISIPNSSTPPALPPKKSKTKSISPIPPVSPRNLESVSPLPNDNFSSCATNLTTNSNHRNSTDVPKSNNLYTKPVLKHAESVPQRSPKKIIPCKKPISESVEIESEVESINLLEELDASNYLVKNEDGQELRGGHPIALMIHATKAKNFTYQDAFLTTYRTFMQPLELVQKLQYRHHRFSCHSDLQKQKAAKDAFSLLVRVVSDLTISDLNEQLLQTLMEFVYQLICNGDLAMAKVLRVKILEKYTAKQLHTTPPVFLSSLNVYTRNSTLLDFKSEQIAEQMTLLDADLFMKIEIPEVLIWAQEQNEERSPNLTQFTEHFNKMSYWARSRILEHDEAKDREKYVVKFIKIMKHLRKINNFNSYLALLSALDSAPIRRLEWQKQITEGLKEYCALIDSSSSFRAYRQALAETHPPCIPYIGLVLQDLTFVHIGNSDVLQDGSINFSKRWQQFNIVENMKRFKKGTYTFKKHDRIIAFFNNFEDYICEEAMWQISEKIKPRGGKKNIQ